MTSDALGTVLTFFDSCANRELDRVEELLDDDCVYWNGSLSVSAPGNRTTKSGFLETLKASTSLMPEGGVRFKFNESVASDNMVALEGWGTATVAGGGSYENHYIFFVEVRDGRILRLNEYWDANYVGEALGLELGSS
jgi:ketosteroid isomerase-like protein